MGEIFFSISFTALLLAPTILSAKIIDAEVYLYVRYGKKEMPTHLFYCFIVAVLTISLDFYLAYDLSHTYVIIAGPFFYYLGASRGYAETARAVNERFGATVAENE